MQQHPENEWTPGPWSVADNGFWVVRGMLSDEKLIAKVAFGDVGYARERANARLIAAAPELFEALAEAKAALHQHYVDWDGEPEDAVPLQLARDKAGAALAKVTSK